ncbi:cytochrome P450 [Stigmatella sp. ncwal1]|uniref:Cytochrome P450 n=1 Tax=Stigmatella ashevillensis TaxID=2995309 RepID=A0ABT5DLR5_9BACT|nr:cytochrome P450 [Stigmatella ashevillena]MDC0713673.1 cytochrome P450 [Stigmatella ashevillena]
MTRRVNILSDDFRANPYPGYAELRRHSPVTQVEPSGLWAISRYEDVLFVLDNPLLFSAEGIRAVWEPTWLGYNPLAHAMAALEGPEHAPLRTWMRSAFHPTALQRMEPRVRQIANALSDELLAQGSTDFIASFALPLSALVLSELLGLEASDYRLFKNWSDDFACILPKVPSEDALRIRHTVTRMTGHLSHLIEERRKAPSEDLVSAMLRDELPGQTPTDRERVELLTLLLAAGLETTVPLLANGLILLANQPELLAQLRADTLLLPRFIEELLRYDPPSHGILRTTLEEVELSGVTIPKGAGVLALTGSAGRDERRYPEADRFILHREQPSLAFGRDAHTCLGAPLARMQAHLGLEALLSRFEGFSLLPADLTWNKSLTVRSPHALPLGLTRAGAQAGATSSTWVESL